MPTSRLQVLKQELNSGKTSSVEIIKRYLERISKMNKVLHAYVEVYEKEAIQEAAEADYLRKIGKQKNAYHGIPIAIKDNIEYKGHNTYAGCSEWNIKAEKNPTAIKRLKENGLIVIGKTHTAQFALDGWGTNTVAGTPRNPWDQISHRVPGGSSSGSAVAVAADLAPWALGTDTGGSVRIPAAWCGITGLKVTERRIPDDGLVVLSKTLDSIGPMTETAFDAKVLWDMLRGQKINDGMNNNNSWKKTILNSNIGILPDNLILCCEQEIITAYHKVIENFKNSGITCTYMNIEAWFEETAKKNSRITVIEGWNSLKKIYKECNENIDPNVKNRLLSGSTKAPNEYEDLLKDRKVGRNKFISLMEKYEIDYLVTPTVHKVACKLEDIDRNIVPAYYTRFVNYWGLCAIAIPMGVTKENLPVSLQIVGKPNDEEGILNVARFYQEKHLDKLSVNKVSYRN